MQMIINPNKVPNEVLQARAQIEFHKRLEEGKQYEDFITDLFRSKFGIAISTYSSYKYQREKGENAQGFEIKFDKGVKTTNNLFIEIEEEGHAAGILKNDNTLFFIQGDYKRIFWFTLKDLKEEYLTGKYKVVESKNKCKGFLYPVVRATQKSIVKIELGS